MDKRCKRKDEMKTKTDGWDGATRLYIALPFCPRLIIERKREEEILIFLSPYPNTWFSIVSEGRRTAPENH